MLFRVVFILILAVCSWHAAFSFSPVDSVREHYVESYPDKFYLKPIYAVRNFNMAIRSRISGSRINYHPNGNAYVGFGVYVFNIGIEGSIKLPESDASQIKYGTTDYFDFQTNLYAKKWGADLAIQRYNGFYVRNPLAHFSNWSTGSPYPRRPDLSVNQVTLNGFYLFNYQKFSYRSAYNQADRQRRSGGSFLLGTTFVHQDILADTSLIPKKSQPLFELEDFHSSTATSLGLLPGYTHSFVYHYFYLNISVSAGPAISWNYYREDGRYSDNTQLSLLANFRAAVGYNSPRWFTGITYLNQQSNLFTPHLDINVESGNFKFFIGYRFKEVGILKKDLFQLYHNLTK